MEPKSSSRLYPVCGKDLNSSNSYHTNKWPEVPTYRNVVKMTGCLEIIDGGDSGIFVNQDDSRPSSSSSLRSWSRGSVGYAPGRVDSSHGRFVNTPTKQVVLQAVPRKEESFRLESNVETSQLETRLSLPKREKAETEKKPLHLKLESNSHNIQEQKNEVGDKDRDRDEKDGDDDDDDEDDDDDSDSSDEDEEKRRAPNELLMEFVDSLMRKDFPTASKLCKMILLYEPEHKEALKFQPLIEEKIILDAEAENESTDEEDDEGTDDDDDSDDEEEEDNSSDEEDSGSEDDSSNDEGDDDNDGCHAGGGSHPCASHNNPQPSHIPRPCHQRR